jgi:hypothetical protein
MKKVIGYILIVFGCLVLLGQIPVFLKDLAGKGDLYSDVDKPQPIAYFFGKLIGLLILTFFPIFFGLILIKKKRQPEIKEEEQY